MRRAELMLKQVQRATENERAGTQDGISLEEYYQYFTDGLRFLQNKIMLVNAKAFRASQNYTPSGAEAYDLPADIDSKGRVVTIAYSASGQVSGLRPLEKRTALERISAAGTPSHYILQGSQFLLNAYPSSGLLRATYDRLLPAVDKRRGTVASRTISTTALTALTLSGYTAADFELSEHLSVVDFNGTVLMRGIPYTSVNSGTGVVSIQGSSYTFPEGSTCPVGAYAVLGGNASSHCLIDDKFESFLITYCQKRILMRDSSMDAAEIAEELIDMWRDGVALYGDEPDTDQVPITDFTYEFGDW